MDWYYGKVIGPCELPENLTGEAYLNFLRHELPNFLEDIPLSLYREMWFQQDGCPAHFRVSVRQFLDQEYPNRWIGRSGTISWPARSPDLNPLDFFYWGAMKEMVYAKPIGNVEQLRFKITEAAELINSRNFARDINRSLLRRLRACIRVGGLHFEHLL